MNETSLEDLMLQAAYNNFFDMIGSFQVHEKSNETISEINNQMYLIFSEILKEILVQAEFQLNCYRCHQKLLKKDQNTLINSLKSLKEERILINTSKSQQNFDLDIKTEEAFKRKTFLEEQCLNFESKINSFYLSSNSLIEYTKDLSLQSKDRDLEIKKLLDLSDSIKDKSTNANNSSIKADTEKSTSSKVTSPKFSLGSYISGIFRRKEENEGSSIKK